MPNLRKNTVIRSTSHAFIQPIPPRGREEMNKLLVDTNNAANRDISTADFRKICRDAGIGGLGYISLMNALSKNGCIVVRLIPPAPPVADPHPDRCVKGK